MRVRTFSIRTMKEILRDPLTIAFGLGFPVVLLLLLSAMQANIPVEMFTIERLTPGITVFGLAFMGLFAATLVAKDRESALLQRLYTTPLTAWEFILGYILPLLPVALAQSVICYAVALCLGLPFRINILYAIIGIIPIALFFISLGVACGSVLGVKAASGICGGLLTNVSAWLSGIWFDLALVGSVFQAIANVLPFVHAVELARSLLSGNFVGITPHILWTVGYAVAITALAVGLFFRQMKRQ